MNILSIVYSSISIVVVLLVIGIILSKQFVLKSTAVYYFLAMVICILFWVIGDLAQIIYSKSEYLSIVLILSRLSTTVNILAMVSVVLFANSLGSNEALKSFTSYIIFFLAGGSIALTFVDSIYTVSYDPYLDFIVTQGEIIWVVFDAVTILFATCVFLSHLIKQHTIVEAKDKKATLLMIIGAVIAFLVSLVFYVVYALLSFKPTLHLELVSTAIGALLIAIGMLYGSKRSLYGSSKLYSIQIFNTSGINIYAGEFIEKVEINHQLTAALATAIATLTSKLIGEEIFPKEINLGRYSMILSQKNDFISFIVCEHPSKQIHQGLKKIIDRFDPNLPVEKIEEIIQNYLPYGKPNSIKVDIVI